MSEPDVLGWVTWLDGERTATLRVDGSWTVLGADWLEPAFRLIYSDLYRGPIDGPFGPEALNRLAADVGGTATILDRPGPGLGTVY